MTDECIHGMDPTWCGICLGSDRSTGHGAARGHGYYGGQTKQDLLDDLCDLLGLPHEQVGVGSSLPSEVFTAAARRAGVSGGSMPEIGEAIALKAGLPWTPDCDSRGSVSGGGSTVTAEGLRVLVNALGKLP